MRANETAYSMRRFATACIAQVLTDASAAYVLEGGTRGMRH
jgi:hypothetical protein